MISTRSNYYREVDFVSPLTSVKCSQYTMRIYIWSGASASPPATATYELTRLNYADSSFSEKIEIGQIIKSYITNYLTTPTGTQVNQLVGNQMWVKTTIEYVTTDTDDDGVEQDPITTLALNAYGYGNEGENYQIPSVIQLSSTIYKTSKNTLFTIPVYCASSQTATITSIPDNKYPYPNASTIVSLASSTNTNGIIKLVVIDTSLAGTDSQILIVIGAVTIRILLDDEQKYTNTDLYFINKYGCQQTISMRKQRKESIAITSERYESFGLQPSTGIHQYNDFNINGKTSVQLSSGFIPESNNSAIKELLLSEKIWMRYNGATIPVNIKSKSLEYKTRINDQLVNYTLDFDYSYNEINNA